MFKRFKNKKKYIVMSKYSNFLYTIIIFADKRNSKYLLVLRDIRFNDNKFIILHKSNLFEKIILSFYSYKDLLDKIDLKILKTNESKYYLNSNIDITNYCKNYLKERLSNELDILRDILKSKKYRNIETELNIEELINSINDFLYKIEDVNLNSNENIDLIKNIINFLEEDCLLLNLILNISE